MTIARFTVPATLYAAQGRDAYGMDQFGVGATLLVAVVKFLDDAQPTPIRSEASASRGAAEQDIAVATLLAPVSAVVATNDRLDMFGYRLVVIGVRPSFDAFGKADHQVLTLKAMEN